jgi:hypothetical protein
MHAMHARLRSITRNNKVNKNAYERRETCLKKEKRKGGVDMLPGFWM